MPSIKSESSKELFRRSIFDMYYEQECIRRKRKVYLRWIHWLDASIVVIPTIIIFLIGLLPQSSNTHLNPQQTNSSQSIDWLKILLSCASACNIVIAIINFYPFRIKSSELLGRSARIETLINEMRFCWRKYDLGIIDLETFEREHETYYLEYGKNLDVLTEEYQWPKEKHDDIKKIAQHYMDEYL